MSKASLRRDVILKITFLDQKHVLYKFHLIDIFITPPSSGDETKTSGW